MSFRKKELARPQRNKRAIRKTVEPVHFRAARSEGVGLFPAVSGIVPMTLGQLLAAIVAGSLGRVAYRLRAQFILKPDRGAPMITEDQTETIRLLATPATHGGAAVEQIDTHASVVFVAGTRAWKLKRAVHYDYLDFSTVDRRKAMCEAEVRVNRRTAPFLYRGVVAVVRRPDGSLALGGPGAPIDWVVEMHRFDQDVLFDRLAGRGALQLETMAPLAVAIARFHAIAEQRVDHGGRSGMAWVIDGNAQGFAEQGHGVLDPALAGALTTDSQRVLEHHGRALDRRRQKGYVRQCHGDLHLRNIVLIDGLPTLFDAIEFNDEIACIDVLYDLAFLLMDLWRRQLPRHANTILNTYL